MTMRRRDFLKICSATLGAATLGDGIPTLFAQQSLGEDRMSQDRNEIVLERAYHLGFECGRIYRGCSQCVVAAVQDTLGIRDDAVFKAATGLAGGIGLSGVGPCGAISGGVLVLSQLVGRERSNIEDPENLRSKSYDLAKKLVDAFLNEIGAFSCRDVQMKRFGRPYYLRDQQERKKFEDAGAREKCTDVVGRAARMTVKIILDAALVAMPE